MNNNFLYEIFKEQEFLEDFDILENFQPVDLTR